MTEGTPRSRTSAAALSAAVDSTKSIGDAPTSQAEPTPKKHPNPNASRSSGGSAREGLLSEKPPPSQPPHRPHVSSGGSAREELLSEKPPPSQPPHRPHVSSGGGPGEGASLSEKRPPPEYPRTPTPVSSDVRRGGGLGVCGELRAWARDRRAAENLPASVDQGIAPLRPRCRCRGQPRKQRSVNVGSRSCKSPLTAGYASVTTVMHRRESAA